MRICGLQMEAATITPAANPVSPRRRPSVRSRFKNSTPAAPREVPAKGISTPARLWRSSDMNVLLSVHSSMKAAVQIITQSGEIPYDSMAGDAASI